MTTGDFVEVPKCHIIGTDFECESCLSCKRDIDHGKVAYWNFVDCHKCTNCLKLAINYPTTRSVKTKQHQIIVSRCYRSSVMGTIEPLCAQDSNPNRQCVRPTTDPWKFSNNLQIKSPIHMPLDSSTKTKMYVRF